MTEKQIRFKVKAKITGRTPKIGNTKVVEISIPLKHFSNFLKSS